MTGVSPWSDDIDDAIRTIEHYKSMVRTIKSVLLRFPDRRMTEEHAPVLMQEYKREVRDWETRLEEYRRKHFEWMRENT